MHGKWISALVGVVISLLLSGCVANAALVTGPFSLGAMAPGSPDRFTAPTTPTPVSIESLTMFTATTGWAVSDKGRVLHTSAGTTLWNDVTPPKLQTGPGRTAFFSLSANLAWVGESAVGDTAPAIFRTIDAGKTWQAATLPLRQGAGLQITFSDPRHGWILAGLGAAAGSFAVAILQSTDGGKTWITVSRTEPPSSTRGSLPFGGNKTGLAFRDASVGWATGTIPINGYAYIFVTHDGGHTWQHQALSLPLEFKSAQLGIVPPQFFTPSAGILPVTFLDPQGVTFDSYVTRDSGTTWHSTTPLHLKSFLSVSDFRDVQHGWVADSLHLYATLDGGRTWHVVVPTHPQASEEVSQLDFISTLTGWKIIREEHTGVPRLLKTTNSGHTWKQVSTQVT